MVNRYTLGSIVLGIFLMAILGVSRAMSWLTQSNAKNDNPVVAVEADRNNVNGITDINRISQGDSTSNSQSAKRQLDETVIRQTDGTDDEIIVLRPLEEAGTYIQRQKRVEEDKVIAKTEIEVIPVANNNIQAKPDTITPNAPATKATKATKAAPSQTRPVPASPAVPALW